MQLIVGVSTLVGLTVARPPLKDSPSGRSYHSVSPVWMKSSLTPGIRYYTLARYETPSAGEHAWDVCSMVAGSQGEPYCPGSAAEAEEVYSNLLAEHFMPVSVAAGHFNASEVGKIQPFALGVKAQPGYPATTIDQNTMNYPVIDHTTLVLNDGSVNDVYKCGPMASGPPNFGGFSTQQWNPWGPGRFLIH